MSVITGAGFYRQRNGAKAEVTGQSKLDGRWYGRPADCASGHSWNSDGTSSSPSYNITGPWIDDPPFRISTHGCGVYETRDGREANVTLIKSGSAFSYPASGTVAGCAGEYTWTDEGQESAVFKARRDLVRYIGPLPPEPQWTPTSTIRVSQRWTCGNREEWRAVEIVK